MGTTAEALQLEVRRVLTATPTEVFTAWTQAASLGAWFKPRTEMTTIVHHLDARLGGSYRIEMRAADGTPNIAHGTYTEFAAPHRLAFTWSWEGKEGEESLVELDMHPSGAQCELVLRHSRFATPQSRDGHSLGWEGCLTHLAAHFSST